jgi:isoleucyl-tRNA synthetase
VEEKEFEILEEMKGKDLEGMEYVPLFDYYQEKMQSKGCFKVLCGEHVTSGAGTGIVHTAPAFGEEDYAVCRKYDIIDPSDPCVSINENGEFLDLVTDYKGMYIKDADKQIIKDLKEKKRLVKQGQIVHSYPFCWRSDTPLIYMAQNTWFIRVTDLKEKLLVNNLKSRWVPEFA